MVEDKKLPEGYKITEVGVIPENWNVDSIGNLSAISTGSKNTQDKVEDGEFPFFVRSSIVERINTYSFDGEAVLTAGDGVGTGRIFHYIKGKFDFHQRVYKISNFNEQLNGYFFYLYFSNNFLSRIMSMTAKSSVDSVRREMISDMKIPLPTIPEQQAIAEVLIDVDNLIVSLEKLITKKKKIKQGAMQELLTGKKRLPGFTGEWEVKNLDDIFEITAGGDLKKNLYSEVKDEKKIYPIYSNGLANGGLYGYCSVYDYDENAITITARGTIGVAKYRDHKFVAIGRLLVLRPKEKIDCLFVTEFINNRLTFAIESTSVPQLTAPQVSLYKISFPKQFKEQQAIAQILTDIDAEIERLEKRLEKYKSIKQGMMQELLTGRIRLI